MFTPIPESCSFGVGGGRGETTLGSTLASEMRRGGFVIISRLGFSRVGAGGFRTMLGGLGIGGTLMILRSKGGGIRVSTGGVPSIGATRAGAVGMCSVLGCGAMVTAGTIITTVRRICTW